MTQDINDYSVTVFHGEKIGPKLYRARAQVFRRDRPDIPENCVAEFVTFGTTMKSADKEAYRQAKRFVKSQGKPLDRKDSNVVFDAGLRLKMGSSRSSFNGHENQNIEPKVLIRATREKIYNVLMNEKKHSQFTGAPAKVRARR